MEDSYIIQGGGVLKGEVTLSGAKNLALKTVIASLLFESPVILTNVPQINDIHELLHLIKKLGATVEQDGGTVTIDPSTLSSSKPDLLHASKLRASFLLFAPLLHKFKECRIPNPGGCRIGMRPIDRIVQGMEALGVTTEYHSEDGYYDAKLPTEPNGSYKFAKPTHTGTELLIMIAAIGSQTIMIENAALEPEIDELIKFLNEAGAKIERMGTSIIVTGVRSLKQAKPFHIFCDRNEAVTFAILAVATKGWVEIHGLKAEYLTTFNEAMKKVGVLVEELEDSIKYSYRENILPVSIVTEPHPGFMTDWQPNWAVLMTQSNGISTIHETVFENRFSYVDELLKLGAQIEYVETSESDKKTIYHFNADDTKTLKQKISITGGAPLHSGAINISDLRAGATLLIAALIAKGETVVSNASILERGYENIVEKISGIGGKLKRV
ncbi:MAG: UDP-N-acetylglucosamine 1-carboxyvinyltransferase [Microgenomates group bacterium]|jgi:UDP-N-acetylglucosamine 1-carboxyvinyltransferase|nr:UDP-N-acetylglucosamine 1-carboxyvinyltransferase [Candidatus Woesebacteria bacterium]MBP6882936.1 UDP-N-acetylglucosamine 1-carboxyvinyltransferase [Candidatus Woesebacteria bacterium]